jgi:hypothetical protein
MAQRKTELTKAFKTLEKDVTTLKAKITENLKK